MKTCFVSIPFGRKTDYRTGVIYDFDRLYFDVIKPAVENAGIFCFKDVEMSLAGDINRQTLSAVMGADIMITDITTSNPNVFYELGVRHALRNETTILIMARNSIIPSYAGFLRVLTYDYDEVLNGAGEFSNTLTAFLKRSIEYKSVDSPLYQMFQDLRVDLPRNLEAMKTMKEQMQTAKQEDESVLQSIDALQNLQRNADYSGMIQLAESLPQDLQKHPEIRQLWAMALVKRRKDGDDDRAVEMMQELITETGGDTESYSILGSIYKRRYHQRRDIADLDAAIKAYRKSYALQPSDYYTGLHLLRLLFEKDTAEATDEFSRLLPNVKTSVEEQLKDGKGDFWSYSVALELACMSADWDKANQYIDTVITTASSAWMTQSLVQQFEVIRSLQKEEVNRKRLTIIIDRLNKGSLQEERVNV